MLQNYLISTFRNLLKNPLFSIINIGGLALGIAVCILVYLYVDRETHFDSWVDHPENIYRVELKYNFDRWGTGYMTSVPVPLQVEVQDKFPEVQHTTLFDQYYVTVKKDNTVFYEQLVEVDTDFFEMFSLTFLHGDPSNAMPNQNSIVISQNLATKYFGAANPIGQILTVEGDREMMVSAVFEDMPAETHMKVDGFVTYRYGIHPYQSQWSSNSPWMYVQVDNPADIPAIYQKFYNLVTEHTPFMSADEEKPNDRITIFLQPFSDVHLKSSGRSGDNPNGNLTYIYGYIGIALLILSISCINYINLSTARATKRTKEVCMRKIMGANRKQLLGQFIGETITLSFIALLVALVLVAIALPWFKEVVGGELSLNLFGNAGLWILFVAILAFTGIVAGAYPAVIVSRFRPSQFLHANKSEAGASARLRNILVILQFGVATALIAIVSVIHSQMQYMNNMDLGYDSEGLVVLRGVNDTLTKSSMESLRTELERLPGVQYAVGAYNVPGDGRQSSRNILLEGSNPDEQPSPRILPSDYEFLEALKVPLIAGRYLDRNLTGDDATPSMERPPEGGEIPRVTASVVITRETAKELGYTENLDALIGKSINVGLNPYGAAGDLRIVGIVEDFVFGMAKDMLQPIIFYRQEHVHQQMMLRIDPLRMDETLTEVDRIWKQLYPDVPVRRQFVEERLEQRIAREAIQSQLFLSFSVLAILLSCLGLLGLAIFTAENRTKEIGVRKVMGASVPQIVQLLTWEFSKPMLVANVLAIPASWYFASGWLESFTRRIDLGAEPFILAALSALIIGWLTVGGHSYKAARGNPIKALRYE